MKKEEKGQRRLEARRRKDDERLERRRRRDIRQRVKDEIAAKIKAAEDRRKAEEEAAYESESSVDSREARELEEEAKQEEIQRCLKIAERGNFVGDIKIICASGLPKVDFWGAGIDPYVRIHWCGEEISRTAVKKGSLRPRFDHHVKIDFEKGNHREEGDERERVPPPDNAVMTMELYDWDRIGDDDFVSQVTLTSLEIREGCCLPEHRPVKYNLEARPNAKKKEIKFAQGCLLLQFNLAKNIDYKKEAELSAKASTNLAEVKARRIAQARKDFQV